MGYKKRPQFRKLRPLLFKLESLPILDSKYIKQMAKNILIAVLFLCLVALTSCSPTWHLKQAERHLRKAEIQGASVRVDTVYATKEVIVPEVKFDTVTAYLNMTDTITVTKDNIITRVRIDTIKKRVYISTVCPPDTVKIRVPVTVTREIKSGFPWGWIILAWCIGAAMGLFATKSR